MKKKGKILSTFGLLMAGATSIIVIYNKLVTIFSNAKDKLSTENGRFYSWRFGKIYYTKTGSGSPVLLIHDLYPYSSSYEWHKITKQLSRKYTVYAIDLLGCGRSEKPNFTYTNYMYVQLVNDFIRNIIKSKTSVVATGSSLSFVVMACQMEAENFKKIIGVSPTDLNILSKQPSKRHKIINYLIEIPAIGNLIYNVSMTRGSILDKFVNRYYYKDYLISNNTLQTYYHSAHMDNGNGKYLFSSICSHYTNINIAPTLKRIDTSISLIGGREDAAIHNVIEEYQILNPSIEAAYVPNAKYLPQLETPDKFAGLLNIIL